METKISSDQELMECFVPMKADKKTKPEPIQVKVNGINIGGSEVIIVAGPCAVENMEQLVETAVSVKRSSAKILRGGAFKPRSSPYSFQGLGEEGLKMLREISIETGLPVVTEVMDTRQIETVCRYADMLQVGSRNMQNYLICSVGVAWILACSFGAKVIVRLLIALY